MIDTIKVIINGKTKEFTKGITLSEIVGDYQNDFKYPIILAKVNDNIRELSYALTRDCKVTFLDLTDPAGNRTHISGLTYLLIYAIKELYGRSKDITVEHSIDKGIYIKTNFTLTEDKLKEIKHKMKEISKTDTPITKLTIDRLEAIDYYEKVKNHAKADVLKFNTNTYVTLYRLGNLYDYFYNFMPTLTSQIQAFDLTYLDSGSFVLRFPTVYESDKIEPYHHHPNMFDAFSEYSKWAAIMNVETTSDINKIVSTGKINDLIHIDETLQNSKLLDVAKEINKNRKEVKIVLLAGPSSSGKTTTSRKLCMYLHSFGLNPKVISMDDYFKNLKDVPKKEDGTYDFESLRAVNMELFDSQIERLLNGDTVKTPTYNFILGRKEYIDKIDLDKDEILLIEGIHALDKAILKNIPRSKKTKIYISPLTELRIDSHNRISTTDNRLLRRIIRDNRTRGYSVEDTLAAWPAVRDGEEKYIFTCQDEADITINSALIYEIGVLRTYVEPLLYNVDVSSPYYEEAKRLMNFLRLFLPVPSDDIPQDSVLREFIGNSYFNAL